MRENIFSKRSICHAMKGILFFGVSLFSVIAKGEGDVDINFKGTLVVPPPCIINGDTPIELNFGVVDSSKIDNSAYKKTAISYSLTCTESMSTSLRMQIKGIGTSFDSSILKTSQEDMGILLMRGSNRVPLNTWVNIDSNFPPNLVAIPYIRSDKKVLIKAGDFSATAAMQVDYL
ncbi:TPA: fimbrial protein [Enterobacter kobei]|nr:MULTISPECIES: fimbrial protein [Enterobacter cloacae complex]MCK7215307.1 fimbrial protein [Enterobacter kobei]MEB8027323.1 fimbrial protein [Enterobacter hormaechei]HCR2142943.1 fimbrial protein [Enterobacter kobei]HDZ8320321.1 fimbrial protein [Enterobacter kobei]